MLRLYMMRHGETVWNTERRYQGMTDIELSGGRIKTGPVCRRKI